MLNSSTVGGKGFNSILVRLDIETAPFLDPVVACLRNSKTQRELREAFFSGKFTPQSLQTLMNTTPNAIFQCKGLKIEMAPALRGIFRGHSPLYVNRVCCFQ